MLRWTRCLSVERQSSGSSGRRRNLGMGTLEVGELLCIGMDRKIVLWDGGTYKIINYSQSQRKDEADEGIHM